MVFIKDLINHLEFLRMNKLTHDINAYKQFNINKTDNDHVIVYKFLDKLLDEIALWNKNVDAFIIDANSVITIDNFKNKHIIIENKKKLFSQVTLCEKTLDYRFWLDSSSFYCELRKLIQTLDLSITGNEYAEDGIYNKILFNDFTNISLGDFITYIYLTIHTIISKVHFYESDIKFYISDSKEDADRRKALHYLDYRKEVYFFFTNRLN